MVRRILIPVVLAAALTLTTALPTAQARPGGRTVAVMTFNIHHAAGTDGVLAPDRIAQVIKDSGADIVGLQEVDRHYSERSEWADQAAQLAALTGFHVVFGANIDNEPPAGSTDRIQYGTAILSRYPITSWDNTHLYRSPDQEQRGLLHATINIAGRKIAFYNTHLAASSQVDRQQQADQIVDLVGETEPAILVGDLNAEADAPEIKTLTGRFTDVWPAVGEGPGLTIPSEQPEHRIDFILTGSAARPITAEVVDSDPVASDHRPVISTISIG